jgi:hypothetical protein
MRKTIICMLALAILGALVSCGPVEKQEKGADSKGTDWDKQLTDYYSKWEFDTLHIQEDQSVNYGLLKRQSDTLIIYLDSMIF